VDVSVLRLDPTVELPSYSKPLDAGLDLRSAEDTVIKPGERKLVRTGISLALPENFVSLIWDRSGNAFNHGITCLGGVIDAGYRGEYKVIMVNLGSTDFAIKKNDRIAQLLIQPVVRVNLKLVETLDETHRGAGGFGSTGKD